MRPFPIRLTDLSSASAIDRLAVIALIVWVLFIFEAVHGVVAAVAAVITAVVLTTVVVVVLVLVAVATSETRLAVRAAPWAFVVTREGVSSSKLPSTFGTRVRPLAGVELGVSLQVMETPKASLAGLADVWLFLAVGEQMAFEVVVPGEIGGTVWTLVTFGEFTGIIAQITPWAFLTLLQVRCRTRI